MSIIRGPEASLNVVNQKGNFFLAKLLVRFPNPLAPAPDTCQLGNPTTSSLSQQGG